MSGEREREGDTYRGERERENGRLIERKRDIYIYIEREKGRLIERKKDIYIYIERERRGDS